MIPLQDSIGYGNLSAPLWFIGLEEGLGKRYKAPHWTPEWELAVRAALPLYLVLTPGRGLPTRSS